jgi:putative endonuclease
MIDKHNYVYVLTNKNNTVLYTGVTADLAKRIWQHKEKVVEGFTKRYNLDKLVYYEAFEDINNAIAREKQIKGSSRLKKIGLIEGMNKDWKDLYDEL